MADYLVKIEDNIISVDLINTNKIKINDKEIQFDLKFKDEECYLTYKNKSFEATVLSQSESFVVVSINNDIYEVEVKDRIVQLSEKFTKNKDVKAKQVIVRAPMPGLVLKILVNVGQKVEKGSSLLILEAMKMENEIKTNNAGIVKEILVKEKTAVEKGDILIVIE
ncbi:MAG: Biotin carboxyl carrier protein of methylmalonyl-CoA decarboxylase [Ignavibacteriae bacterium]|nr:MAG: Biotin carboxyl carrier protein of methylmalonyl-CoA decarboxylase [Ignavibacteriota bacterium]